MIYFNLWIIGFFILLNFLIAMTKSPATKIEDITMHSVIGSFLLTLNSYFNLFLLLVIERYEQIKKFSSKFIYITLTYFFNAILFVGVVFTYSQMQERPTTLQIYFSIFVISLLINTLILILQNYIILQDQKTISDIENAKLREAHSNAANQLLRQQIHPHFLFNALNVLKSLYKINPQAGEKYLIRLSNFLRAAVSTNNIKVISIKEELNLCIDYLEMQKIRFSNALNYSISVPDETQLTGSVPSFSIQPLVENAIKHNEITVEVPLTIQITVEKDWIKVNNNFKPKKTSESNTGIGLINLSERYRLLANEDIVINEEYDSFSVSIKILSYENRNN